MPGGAPIGDREREILTAIVETFIATGEPVGSRTLSRSNREGLSPATIRNVMADLVDAGFLEQPHTSAGRVPSSEAYRYYVEQLTGKARLSHEDEDIIHDSLHGITDVQEFMERTSHVLSLLSRNVGVAVAMAGPKNALEHVYFSRLGDQKVLAVVVTQVGPGAGSGVAHGSAAVRTGSGGQLHQCQFSWLDYGGDALRTGAAIGSGTQRIRPADGLRGTVIPAGRFDKRRRG